MFNRHMLIVDRHGPREFRAAFSPLWHRAGRANVRDREGIRDNARLAGFLWSLLGQKPAVDRERVAGDHRRGGARQVKDRQAISSGVASRLSGVSAAMRSTIPGWSSSGAVKLVRTQVGATALTRIPEGAHSTASALVILTTPPFVA
jgi:hypothetical protein